MAYTTEAIVREESSFKNSSNIDSDYVTRAIAQADSFIDGKITGVYVIPLSETPSIIQDISTTLAVYNLITDQNLNVEIASGVNVSQMIADALALLDQIIARKLMLVGTDGEELSTRNTIKVGFAPNDATTEAETTPREFSMTDIF